MTLGMSDSREDETASLDRRKAVLSRITAFASLPPEVAEEIAGSLRAASFTPGVEVVREGDIGDQLFVIERGAAEVFTQTAAGVVLLTKLAAGDMFGEIALLNPTRRRQATVKATEPLDVLTLSAADFEKSLAAFPELRVDVVMAAEAMLHEKFIKRKAGPAQP